MPFLVAAQLVWDSSELGNLQKKRKNMTVQINEKSLLTTYFVLKLPPPPLPPPHHPFLGSYKYTRARNYGRSTDKVRTDWGIDRSTFHFPDHVDWSHSIVL